MKKFIALMVVAAVVLIAAGQARARAEEGKLHKGHHAKQYRMENGKNVDRGRHRGISLGAMQQRRLKKVSNMITKLRSSHEELIAALAAVRVQAEQEGAAKTVKLVLSLIDKRNKAYTEKIVKLEQEQGKLRERISTQLRAQIKERGQKKMKKFEQNKPESEEEK